jgi:hypothetical protein
MDAEDKKLLKEHSQKMADLQNDFQMFYKIVKQILPEIEHTKTLTRLEKEMSDFKKSVKIDIV